MAKDELRLLSRLQSAVRERVTSRNMDSRTSRMLCGSYSRRSRSHKIIMMILARKTVQHGGQKVSGARLVACLLLGYSTCESCPLAQLHAFEQRGRPEVLQLEKVTS